MFYFCSEECPLPYLFWSLLGNRIQFLSELISFDRVVNSTLKGVIGEQSECWWSAWSGKKGLWMSVYFEAAFEMRSAYFVEDHITIILFTIRHLIGPRIMISWCWYVPRFILGLRPTNQRRRYFVTTSLIGWVQALNQPCLFRENHRSPMRSFITSGFPSQRDSNADLKWFSLLKAWINCLTNSSFTSV